LCIDFLLIFSHWLLLDILETIGLIRLKLQILLGLLQIYTITFLCQKCLVLKYAWSVWNQADFTLCSWFIL